MYVRRGQKDAYQKTASCGKAMYTVLFTVSAAGTFLPLFVVYKGGNLYDSWTQGGPPGTNYGVSPSGWMQDINFESWFTKAFVPQVEHLEKPVVLTFDGHGSHLTYHTVKTAMDKNIILVCLPPNTSHALQPLDVGVFRTVKIEWPKIVKLFDTDSRHTKLDKTCFPGLLAKLWDIIIKRPDLPISGFRGTGLHPLNKEAVSHRIVDPDVISPVDDLLPGVSNESPRKQLVQSIIQVVSPEPEKQPKRKARKRVQHENGEILTSTEVLIRLEIEQKNRQEKQKAKTSSKKPKKKGKKAKKAMTSDENSSDHSSDEEVRKAMETATATEDSDLDGEIERPTSDANDGVDDDVVDDDDGDDDVDEEDDLQAGSSGSSGAVDVTKLVENYSHVIVRYEGEFYPGMVKDLKKRDVVVQCMVPAGVGQWKWPEYPDVCAYLPSDIVEVIQSPSMVNSRGIYIVEEMNNYWSNFQK